MKWLSVILIGAFLVISFVGGPMKTAVGWTETERWILWAAQSLCLALGVFCFHKDRHSKLAKTED